VRNIISNLELGYNLGIFLSRE